MSEQIVVAIVKEGPHVLLIKRKFSEGDLVWTFPSGKIEPNETEKEAVMREVLEETNVSCIPIKRIGERKHPSNQKELVYWLCEYKQGQIKINNDEEIDEVIWAKPDVIFKKITSDIFEPVREILLQLLNK